MINSTLEIDSNGVSRAFRGHNLHRVIDMPILMLCIICIRSVYVYTHIWCIYIYKNIHTKKHTLHIHFFWMWLLGLSYPRQLDQFLRLQTLSHWVHRPHIINLQTPTTSDPSGTRYQAGGKYLDGHLKWWFFLGVFFCCCWPTKQAIRKEKRRTWVFLGAGGMRVEMCSAKFFFGKKKTTWNGWVYFPFSLN